MALTLIESFVSFVCLVDCCDENISVWTSTMTQKKGLIAHVRPSTLLQCHCHSISNTNGCLSIRCMCFITVCFRRFRLTNPTKIVVIIDIIILVVNIRQIPIDWEIFRHWIDAQKGHLTTWNPNAMGSTFLTWKSRRKIVCKEKSLVAIVPIQFKRQIEKDKIKCDETNRSTILFTVWWAREF